MIKTYMVIIAFCICDDRRQNLKPKRLPGNRFGFDVRRNKCRILPDSDWFAFRLAHALTWTVTAFKASKSTDTVDVSV